MSVELILIALILLAGFYMAWSLGANDVANAMGTSVGSGALTMRRAVLVAAILEFSGALFFGSHVTETIQSGIVDSEFFKGDPYIIVYGMLSALIASGIWLQLASFYGWPVSTTHSIVGALVGFGAIAGGIEAIYWDNVFYIVTSWIFSPLLGGVIAYLIFNLLRKHIFYTAKPVENAKKLTPLLVFIVITVLSLTMVYKGLSNIQISVSFFQATGLSILIGLFASIISFFCVREVKSTLPMTRKNISLNPEVALALEKAKKHLQSVRTATEGEVQYQIALILEEIDHVDRSVKQRIDTDYAASEYSIVEKIFGHLQIMSACMMAFAHGANDVANAIGPLVASFSVLTTGKIIENAPVPFWALALGGFGIVIGLATWGWRVIYTIGKKITELTPTRGFAAEFGAALTILLATRLGMPISTTHTLVGAVIGVGLARGIEALDLRTTRDIVISWIVTVPAGAGLAIAIFYGLRSLFTGGQAI